MAAHYLDRAERKPQLRRRNLRNLYFSTSLTNEEFAYPFGKEPHLAHVCLCGGGPSSDFCHYALAQPRALDWVGRSLAVRCDGSVGAYRTGSTPQRLTHRRGAAIIHSAQPRAGNARLAFRTRLKRIFIANHHLGKRARHDFDIEPKRPIAQVVQVGLHAFGHRVKLFGLAA